MMERRRHNLSGLKTLFVAGGKHCRVQALCTWLLSTCTCYFGLRAALPLAAIPDLHPSARVLQVGARCLHASPQAQMRRRMLSNALVIAAGQVSAQAYSDDSVSSADWRVSLPEIPWTISKELHGPARQTREVIFEAKNAENDIVVIISREPLGSVSKKGLVDNDRALELAEAFDGNRNMPVGGVVEIMSFGLDDKFGQRARKWANLHRLPKATQDIVKDNGRRYVQFAFETLDCSGAVTESITVKESCAGKLLPWRRHTVMATVGLEKYLPARPVGGGRGETLESVWQLDVSLPASSYSAGNSSDMLQGLIRSFQVIPAIMPNVEDE